MTDGNRGSGNLEIEQLAALFARAGSGALATLVLVALVIMLLWEHVDGRVLLVWGVASSALEATRLLLARTFRGRQRTPAEAARSLYH